MTTKTQLTLPVTVQRTLRADLAAKGASLKQLSDRTGIAYARLIKLTSGYTRPKDDELRAIASGLRSLDGPDE
jgi:transcriptional regulator with XRE-family HTH domain